MAAAGGPPTKEKSPKQGFLATAWGAFLDPAVQTRQKVLVVAALLYLFSPFDFIPDLFPVGFGDDLVAVLTGIRSLVGMMRQHRLNEAGRKRGDPGGTGPVIDI